MSKTIYILNGPNTYYANTLSLFTKKAGNNLFNVADLRTQATSFTFEMFIKADSTVSTGWQVFAPPWQAGPS